MNRKFFNYDVNLGFLMIIILLIIGMVSFTIYFQNTYEDILTKHSDKLNELEKARQELEFNLGKLNETSQKLELKTEREADLSTKYVDLRELKTKLEDEKGQLEQDLSKTQDDLSLTKTQLTQAKLEAESLKTDLLVTSQNLKNQIAEAEKQRSLASSRQSRIDSMKSELCPFKPDSQYCT